MRLHASCGSQGRRVHDDAKAPSGCSWLTVDVLRPSSFKVWYPWARVLRQGRSSLNSLVRRESVT